jgi:TPR repeat protein
MLYGTMGVRRDSAAAFAMLHQDNQPISNRAKATLAWCYLRGVGTEKNEAKAIEMLQGNTMPRAIAMLADCHYYGTGVELNLRTSFDLYRTAANSNNPRALHRLGFFYEKGFVVRRDIAKAVEFYKRALEAGSTVSKIRLSVVCCVLFFFFFVCETYQMQLEPKEYPMTGQNIKVEELDFLEEIDE